MNQVELSIKEIGCYEVLSEAIRLQDTLPVMLEVLKLIDPHGYEQCMTPACGFPLVPSHALEDENDSWWFENGPCVTEVILDALNEVSPAGFYFGTHEAHGTALGFWPLPN